MHGEPVFDIAWCCQPDRMGHGQHLNLRMDGWMDGWRREGGDLVFTMAIDTLSSYASTMVSTVKPLI